MKPRDVFKNSKIEIFRNKIFFIEIFSPVYLLFDIMDFLFFWEGEGFSQFLHFCFAKFKHFEIQNF